MDSIRETECKTIANEGSSNLNICCAGNELMSILNVEYSGDDESPLRCVGNEFPLQPTHRTQKCGGIYISTHAG